MKMYNFFILYFMHTKRACAQTKYNTYEDKEIIICDNNYSGHTIKIL